MKIELNITPKKAKAMIEVGLFNKEIKEQINLHYQAFLKIEELIAFFLLRDKPLQGNEAALNLARHFIKMLIDKDVEKYVLSELSETRRTNIWRLAHYYLYGKEFLSDEVEDKQTERTEILKDVSIAIKNIKEL